MTWPNSCPSPRSKYNVVIRMDSHEYCFSFEWGNATVFGTASYWISQYLINFGQNHIPNQKIGKTLFEETVACVLGGYGIPAEVALEAFRILKGEGLATLSHRISGDDIEDVLRRPIFVGNRQFNYRFPKQKATRIVNAFTYFSENPKPPSKPLALRKWLLGINGIGKKTASWIVRNHTASDKVAVIDIHIQRAGNLAGFFLPEWKLPVDYDLMEKAFLAFANAGQIPASGLDSLIWSQMRVLSGPNIKGYQHCKLPSLPSGTVQINQLLP